MPTMHVAIHAGVVRQGEQVDIFPDGCRLGRAAIRHPGGPGRPRMALRTPLDEQLAAATSGLLRHRHTSRRQLLPLGCIRHRGQLLRAVLRRWGDLPLPPSPNLRG